MPLRAIARLIQTMLYAQRFFPYYVYNILGGIEEDGESSFDICISRTSRLPASRVFRGPSVLFDERGGQSCPDHSEWLLMLPAKAHTLLAIILVSRVSLFQHSSHRPNPAMESCCQQDAP